MNRLTPCLFAVSFFEEFEQADDMKTRVKKLVINNCQLEFMNGAVG